MLSQNLCVLGSYFTLHIYYYIIQLHYFRSYTNLFHLRSSPPALRSWIPGRTCVSCRASTIVTLQRSVEICYSSSAGWQKSPPSRRPVKFMRHIHVAGSCYRCTVPSPWPSKIRQVTFVWIEKKTPYLFFNFALWSLCFNVIIF